MLQQHLLKIEQWLSAWKIKVNSEKCNHITFTLKKGTLPSVVLIVSNVSILQTKTIKYLGIHMVAKMTWKQHISSKIEQIRIKRREMYWLTSRDSKLNMGNKLLIYETIIKPIWTYGIALWGMAVKSHISKMDTAVHHPQNYYQRSLVCAN